MLAPEPMSLYTERLCLRAPIPRDAEALYDLFADQDVMEGLGKEPVSTEKFGASFSHVMQGGHINRGVVFLLACSLIP